MKHVPMIRIELEHWKQQMLSSFFDHQDQISAHVKDSMERVLSEDHFIATIDKHVEKLVTECIEKELKSYFSYGAGAKMIRSVIEEGFKSLSESNR